LPLPWRQGPRRDRRRHRMVPGGVKSLPAGAAVRDLQATLQAFTAPPRGSAGGLFGRRSVDRGSSMRVAGGRGKKRDPKPVSRPVVARSPPPPGTRRAPAADPLLDHP
jgi:hypothetical protein